MRTCPSNFVLATALLLALPAAAADSGQARPGGALSAAQIRDATHQQAPAAISLFRDFLSLRNDATYPEEILRNLAWMEPAFQARGFQTRRLATSGSPLLLAQRLLPEARRTVLIYLQADGQPVDPEAWQQPDPFTPVLKRQDSGGQWSIIPWDALEGTWDPDWRIFARSASDSKGPMTQFLSAMDVLRLAGAMPAYNLKVIVDTEEELGSPNLAAAVSKHRELLSADLLLIFDGPPHASNRPTVTFGARGIATITLTVHGPIVPQHSGHYGNFMPNPAFHLARILSSMKSADGRVLLPGFYDGILIDEELGRQLAQVPDDEGAILASAQLAGRDQVGATLQESLQYPSLNIRGMASAWVGKEARTVIPATATAEIDMRLVPESDPQRLIKLVREHITAMGYHVIDHLPSQADRLAHANIVTFTAEISYRAFRSEFDSLPGLMARAGMKNLYGEEPILIRTMGGSVPIAPFVETLGVPAAIVPTVNIDNNQHSPNENIRLGNFVEGISILAAVLDQAP
jgi:acetylornithine deacetylase/succinyl-diaminopimelate desuccinylase-like protein